jgi:hypothetical protein
MRDGEHNGIERCEEYAGICPQYAYTLIQAEFASEVVKPRWPRCFLYNTLVGAYVRIPYFQLRHHLDVAPPDGNVTLTLHRNLVSHQPTLVYIR